MKRLILLIGIVFTCISCQRGVSVHNTEAHFAYITNGVASFWTIAEAGARAAGKDLGVSVSVHMPAQGVGDQKRIVEDLLTRGVDGMALSLIDPVNQTELINTAAKYTRVITHDADAPQSSRLVYIGMDNYLAGRMAGKLIQEGMPAGGSLAIFIGRLEQDNARRRRQGVIDELLGRSHDPLRYDQPAAVLKNERFEIVGTYTDQFDRAKAKANVEDVLTRYPDLDGVIGLFAYNPPIALEVITQAGKLNDIRIFGFDEAEETLQAIQDGRIYGTVVQDPYAYGYRSIQMLHDLYKGQMDVIPGDKFINIPARIIRSDSVVSFWADLKQKLSPTGHESVIAPS